MRASNGMIFDVKELTVHDGPGVRATIFFKGCPLRCRWCHNPEGIAPQPQLLLTENGCTGCGNCRAPCPHAECRELGRCARACPRGLLKIAGTRITAEELAERMRRLEPLLAEGGVTVSGGEPLRQPEFLLALLEALRPMHTIVETCGYASPAVFQAAARACSMIYLDIKHADSAAHRELTGVGNEPILENLRWIKGGKKPFLVRIPLIPGCNDDGENLRRTAELLTGSRALAGVELLPLNPFSAVKYKLLGREFPLEQMKPAGPPQPPAPNPVQLFLDRDIPCRLL